MRVGSWQMQSGKDCSYRPNRSEMLARKTIRTMGTVALVFLSAVGARAQRVRGELRLEVHDPHGTAVSPAGELVSEANGFRRTFVAGAGGRFLSAELSFWGFRAGFWGGGVAAWGGFVGINVRGAGGGAGPPGGGPGTTTHA